MAEFRFLYSPEQRNRFQSGALMEEWAARYPELFDERDVSICRNQPDYHFFEWLGAVLLYEATGYLSLIEKYETKSHQEKFDAFKASVPLAVFDHVLKNRTGLPDLFLYKKDFTDWFFCEIKGFRDKLRDHQLDRFREIEAVSGKPVSILYLDVAKLDQK